MNIEAIIESARSVETKHRVAETIYKMPADYWHFLNMVKHLGALFQEEKWFDHLSFLNAFSSIEKPKTYLEVGVRKGGSMAQVVRESPDVKCFGFDQWPPDYAVVTGWPSDAGSEEMVLKSLKQFGGYEQILTEGDSKVTLPKFFSEFPEFMADIALVDGDHSEEGAGFDLHQVLPHTKVIVFDDINHDKHPYLERVWDETIPKDWIQFKNHYFVGTAVAFRP